MSNIKQVKNLQFRISSFLSSGELIVIMSEFLKCHAKKKRDVLCCHLTKVNEWEITKMEVRNEMEIFIALTKYNTHQQHEEGKPLLVQYYFVSILPPLTIMPNVFMRIRTYPLIFIGMVYNVEF